MHCGRALLIVVPLMLSACGGKNHASNELIESNGLPLVEGNGLSEAVPTPTPSPVLSPTPIVDSVPVPVVDETDTSVTPLPEPIDPAPEPPSQVEDFGALLLAEDITVMRSATCLTDPLSFDVTLFRDGVTDFGFWSVWNNAAVDTTISQEQVMKYSVEPYLGDKSVALQARDYCSNSATFKMNLLRKFGNWQSQHFNGMVFGDGEVSVNQLGHVLVDIAVDNSASVLPSSDQVLRVFGETFQVATGQVLTPTDIDNGNYTFRLELADRDAPAEERVLKASVFIQLDPADVAESRFVRVIVPAAQLNWFYEQNYQATPVTLPEVLALNVTLTKAIITAETSENKLVRGLLAQAVDNPDFQVDANYDALNLPELFKDQQVELIRMGFIYQ